MANEVPNWGLYVPTTTDIDVSRIAQVDVKSEEFKELLIRLYQTVSDIQRALNLKDSGYYITTEFNTGKLLFDPTNDFNKLRPIFRVVVDFGALPNAATKSVAHGITAIDANFKILSIVGGASKPTVAFSYLPLPYASATAVANNIEVNMDATNINVITGANYSAYTVTYITIEYVRI